MSEMEWILPDAYGEYLFALESAELAKGLGHKYIRREPTGNARRPWRYIYTVTSGGGVHHMQHMVEGAKFATEGGHYKVTSADGDSVTVEHDETGETRTLKKTELAKHLKEHHAATAAKEKEAAKARKAKRSEAGRKVAAEAAAAAAKANEERAKARKSDIAAGRYVDPSTMTHEEMRHELAELDRFVNPIGYGLKPKNSKPMPIGNPKKFAEIVDRRRVLNEALGVAPWQKTKHEVKSALGMPEEKHREVVKRAIIEGKPVPAGVLAGHVGIIDEANKQKEAESPFAAHVAHVKRMEEFQAEREKIDKTYLSPDARKAALLELRQRKAAFVKENPGPTTAEERKAAEDAIAGERAAAKRKEAARGDLAQRVKGMHIDKLREAAKDTSNPDRDIADAEVASREKYLNRDVEAITTPTSEQKANAIKATAGVLSEDSFHARAVFDAEVDRHKKSLEGAMKEYERLAGLLAAGRYEGAGLHMDSAVKSMQIDRAYLSAKEAIRSQVEAMRAGDVERKAKMEREATALAAKKAEDAKKAKEAKEAQATSVPVSDDGIPTRREEVSFGWGGHARSKQHPYDVGDMVKHKDGTPWVVTSTKSHYIREDGMSFGIDEDRGWLHTATVRPATEAEKDHWDTHHKRISDAQDTRRKAADDVRHHASKLTDMLPANAASTTMPSGAKLVAEVGTRGVSGYTSYHEHEGKVYRNDYVTDWDIPTRSMPMTDEVRAHLDALNEANEKHKKAMAAVKALPSGTVVSPDPRAKITERAPASTSAPSDSHLAEVTPIGASDRIGEAHRQKAKSLGLALVDQGETVRISGNTYDHKDTRIKPHGGRFNSSDKSWSVPKENLHKVLKAMEPMGPSPLSALMKAIPS